MQPVSDLVSHNAPTREGTTYLSRVNHITSIWSTSSCFAELGLLLSLGCCTHPRASSLDPGTEPSTVGIRYVLCPGPSALEGSLYPPSEGGHSQPSRVHEVEKPILLHQSPTGGPSVGQVWREEGPKFQAALHLDSDGSNIANINSLHVL